MQKYCCDREQYQKINYIWKKNTQLLKGYEVWLYVYLAKSVSFI